jgi:hypothetical protein
MKWQLLIASSHNNIEFGIHLNSHKADVTCNQLPIVCYIMPYVCMNLWILHTWPERNSFLDSVTNHKLMQLITDKIEPISVSST